MKKILLFLLILIPFSSPTFSKSIIYECNFGNVSGFFKVTNNNKKTEIFIRNNLKWEKWCSGNHRKLTIFNEGAVCNIEYHIIKRKPLTFYDEQKTTFDFLFKTIKNETKSSVTSHKCSIKK